MSNIIGPTLRMGSRQVLGGSSPHIAGVVVAGSKGWAHMLTTARHLGVLKDFMNKVDEEMEKDPETKKKWSELKDQTQSMAKQASEWAKTAKQATEEASGKLREGATKVREQVAETVKAGGSTLSELKERAGAAASAAGPTKQSDTNTTTTTATSSDGESAAAEQRAETANAAPSGEGGAGSAMGRDAQATPSGQAAVEFLKGVHEGLFQGGPKQQEAGSTPGEREQGGTASQQQQQQQQQGGGWGTEGSQAAGWRSRSPFAGFAAQAERPGSSGDADAEKRSAMARAQQLLATIRKEVADAVLPQQEFLSMTRSRDEVSAPPPEAEQQTAASDLQVVKAKETWWGKYFNTMKDRMGSHPFFQRISSLRESSMMKRGRELAGDIRDQWETSDHPLVHRIQDMQDSLFMETEAAKALREIRLRDPDFDMIRFLHSIKLDVPLLIGAYLRGQKEVLEKHCSDAMLERLMGITNALHSQNHFSDPTILEHSDVELVDLKVLDDEPVIVVQFTCQQINCVRDQFGNVIEGSEDDIQRVYYYWALQQEAQGTVTKSGNVLPPRWQLTEMLVRGMHHLL